MTSIVDAATSLPDRKRRTGLLHRLGPVGIACALLLALLVVVSLLVPVLPIADPATTDLASRLQPIFTPGHLLGTDELGRDLFSRLLWGTRLSLAVGFGAAALSSVIGSGLGVLSAYIGGRIDNLVMRVLDAIMAFPYLLLALAIAAALGVGLGNAMIAIVVANIPFFARTVRGATLGVVASDYVAAARTLGYSPLRIIVREVLPNVMPVIIVGTATVAGWMILETAGLSFLGLGAQPPLADLGGMLGSARNLLQVAPHVAMLPGLVIFVIAVAVNLLGDGIRDLLDPRMANLRSARALPATEVTRSTAPAPVPTDATLQVERLSVQFDIRGRSFDAVSEVGFTLQPGETLGIVGESGSGKSVTALSLLRLVASPPGTIRDGIVNYRGTDLLAALPSDLRALRGNRIAYVFQDPLTTLNPTMTIGRQLAEAITVHGTQRSPGQVAARVLELLELVAIPDPAEARQRYPHQLSGGQRQRVSIAMALANDPDIIIADEPTTALDSISQARVLELMAELQRRSGAAMVFISHDLGVVARICDRVAVMYGGRIVEQGSAAELLRRPRHPYTRRLLECAPRVGRGRDLPPAIPGLPPAIDAMPEGCAFAPRCDLATAECTRAIVPDVLVAPGHSSRCLRVGELA